MPSRPVDMQVEVVLKFARFWIYETRHGGRGTDRHCSAQNSGVQTENQEQVRLSVPF